MARNGTSLEDAHASVKELIAEKVRYLVPMTIIFMVSYIGLDGIRRFRQRPDGHEDRGFDQSRLHADRAQLPAVMGARDHLRARRYRQVRSARGTGRDGDYRAGKLR